MRVTAGTITRARHKKVLAQTKGFHLGRKNLFRQAKQALLKAGVNAYRDKKIKKRVFRGQWIIVLNAGARQYGMSYSQFMNGLAKTDNQLDRKVLATLAQQSPEQFKEIAEKAKAALA